MDQTKKRERFLVEEFDLLINLEKETRALALTSLVKAKKKMGIKLSSYGTLEAANPEADYMLRLGIDNELKFKINQKTYQEIVYEACGLKYDRHVDSYIFELHPEERELAKQKLISAGWDSRGGPTVGLNTGSGEVWKTKRWTTKGFAKLSELFYQNGYQVVLLGGPSEYKRNEQTKLHSSIDLIDARCDNNLRQFAAIVGMLDLLVSGDTIAMHLGIAQSIRVIAIFGLTTAQEIDLYGRGEKISAKVFCSLCFKAECSDLVCMKSISPERIAQSANRLLVGEKSEGRSGIQFAGK